MPQQVIVGSDNSVRVQEVGPIGPAGPPNSESGESNPLYALLVGGNEFEGEQAIKLTIPKLTVQQIFADHVELPVIRSVKSSTGDYLTGTVAFHGDLSDVGGPPDLWLTADFTRDPVDHGYVFQFFDFGNGVNHVYTVKMMDLKASNFLDQSALVDYAYKSAEPLQDSDVATKKYVDDSIETIDVHPTYIIARKNAGGKWALVGDPGEYITDYVGPFDREGIRSRFRVCPFQTDWTHQGGFVNFFEVITNIRNEGYAYDQDNIEIALATDRWNLFAFEEDCRIDTPYPVQAGEYDLGRLYSSILPMTYGESGDFRFDYVYENSNGVWEKALYVRTSYEFFDAAAGDIYEQGVAMANYCQGEYYWKRIAHKVGTDVGSVADSGTPMYLGLNDGLWGIEIAQLSHIDSTKSFNEELILDFQSKDIDPETGVGTSLLIPTQQFVPEAYYADTDNLPLPVIDNSALGMWGTELRLRSAS